MVNATDELTPSTRPAPAKVRDKTNGDVEALRADIRRTRARMGRTLDEIQGQLSPEQIRQQTEDAIREATVEKVEQMAQRAEHKVNNWRSNTMRTIRENPLPAAMAGLGLGWLLYSSRAASEAGEGYDGRRSDEPYSQRYYQDSPRTSARYRYPLNADYETYEQWDEEREFNARYPYGSAAQRRPGTVTRGTGASPDSSTPTAEQMRRAAEETGEAWFEMTDEARRRAEDAAASAREHVSATAENMQDQYSEAVHRAGEFASDLSSEAQERARIARWQAQSGAQQTQRYVRHEAQQMKRTFWETLEENPLAVGIAALAAGAIVGLALPGTERENEMLGPMRDNLVEEAANRAQVTARKAQQVLEETAETAVSEAEKQLS